MSVLRKPGMWKRMKKLKETSKTGVVRDTSRNTTAGSSLKSS